MVTVSEIKQAVSDAEIQLRRAEMCLPEMVELICGRLRQSTEASRYSVNSYSNNRNLAKLKIELRKFNITQNKWMD